MRDTEMQNVIEALRYMAKDGGLWYSGSNSGVWRLGLRVARSGSDVYVGFTPRSGSGGYVGFTQSDVEDFLKYYDTLTNKIGQLEEELTNAKRD